MCVWQTAHTISQQKLSSSLLLEEAVENHSTMEEQRNGGTSSARNSWRLAGHNEAESRSRADWGRSTSTSTSTRRGEVRRSAAEALLGAGGEHLKGGGGGGTASGTCVWCQPAIPVPRDGGAGGGGSGRTLPELVSCRSHQQLAHTHTDILTSMDLFV